MNYSNIQMLAGCFDCKYSQYLHYQTTFPAPGDCVKNTVCNMCATAALDIKVCQVTQLRNWA